MRKTDTCGGLLIRCAAQKFRLRPATLRHVEVFAGISALGKQTGFGFNSHSPGCKIRAAMPPTRPAILALFLGCGSDLTLFLQSFQSRAALIAENLFLRKQLAFYREHQIKPRPLTDIARLSLVFWPRWFAWRDGLMIVKPETLIGWHRKGFRLFWRWKSRPGRPLLPQEIRGLIVRMARENPTWGQLRVAAELSLKLGIFVSPRTVRKYWPWEPEDRGQKRASSQRNVDRASYRGVDLAPG